MTERIQFARSADGVMIAYTIAGEGLPLVICTGWVSHLELEMRPVEIGRFIEALGNRGRRRVIHFDPRGTGLSDRDVTDLSCEARASDLAAVVEQARLPQVNVYAQSMSGPPAIVYAATHPDRVGKLILYGSFARVRAANPALSRALVDLIRAEWNLGSRAIAEIIEPRADKPAVEALSAFFKASASAETAAAILEESLFRVDVREYLPRLTMPVLLLHRRNDPAFDFENARELAEAIPTARLVPLPGDTHIGFQDDMDGILHTIGDFLGDGVAAASAADMPEPTGLQIILFTDMEGSTHLTQRLGDSRAQDIVRTHDAILREALRRHGGTAVKHTGDGVMASFSSASGAVEAAMTIQRGLEAYNAAHPDTPIRVRIGLNAGEPVAEGDDLFGTAVQAAARIAARADPGQILVADVVRQLAAGKRLPFVDRGRVSLKGFRHRFRLYEVRWKESR